MPNKLSGGPYWHVDVGNGMTAPWYMVPFDKSGQCTAPKTRASLLADVASRKFTHVIIFSHGWNNDWESASGRYHRFLNGFQKMRRDHGLTADPAYRPLLLGIFWPSTALVLPWERGPRFAGHDADLSLRDAIIDQESREIDAIADMVSPGDREAFYSLVRKGAPLDEREARTLAELVLPVYQQATKADDDLRTDNGPVETTVDDILQAWEGAARDQTRISEADDDGFERLPPSTTGGSPRSAGFLQKLDPRNIVRTLTVYQMKDRAATVGGRGVASLLTDILAQKGATRVHLAGHSYGAKVVLSALSQVPDGTGTVDSVLLLQPAVNGWCFAGNVNNKNFPGGYRRVLEHVTQPILTTYSRNDAPLTKFFHLAVRRREDLGELKVAMAGRPKPPNEYGALGGFGPAGLPDSDCQFIDLKPVGERYDLSQPLRVWALNGDEAIRSHGEVEVPETYWALYNQITHGA